MSAEGYVIVETRSYTSTDPECRWVVTVERDAGKDGCIGLYTDDAPKVMQARQFAKAIIEACDYAEGKKEA